MSFRFYPGVGMVHLQQAKRGNPMPHAERHRWNSKLTPGQFSQCLYCGCLRMYQRGFATYYKADAASPLVSERPTCTGKPATPKPA